ncbi:ankyrin repeat domain-containing protein [Microdochium nivale]|nr:ankyrin repeat domain-containing protein [Microdochium nivale]
MTTLLLDSDEKHRITNLFLDHKDLLRQLYQGQDGKSKTLKQIKVIMETVHGFPDTIPLAQYEVKLKKDLGLRKKLSAHDWPAVWDHYREIKEKSGARVAIYLNGTEIPFEKAWKEIKRNCNDRTVRPTRLRPLPPGVTIVAQSQAVPSQLTSQITTTRPIPLVAFSQSSNTTLSTVQHIQQRSLSPDKFWNSWKAGNIRNLPYIHFLSAIFSHSGLGSQYQRGHGCGKLNGSDFALLQLLSHLDTICLVDNTLDPALFRFHHDEKFPHNALAIEFDPIWFLAKAVLRLCNTSLWQASNYENELLHQVIFTRIRETSQSLLLLFCGSRLPSIIVACSQLLALTVDREDKDGFEFMMEANLQSFQTQGDCTMMVIKGAAQFGCADILRRVLSRAEPNQLDTEELIWAIQLAGWGDHVSCAELIIDAIHSTDNSFNDGDDEDDEDEDEDDSDEDKDSDEDSSDDYKSPSFLPRYYSNLEGTQTHSELAILKYILEKGADVHAYYDSSLSTDRRTSTPIEDLHGAAGIPRSWHPSLLEFAYYEMDGAYSVMAPYRKPRPGRLERDRICLAAKSGPDELAQYLQSVNGAENQKAKFLQLVLAEQFVRADWDVATTLITGGVDPTFALLELNTNLLLRRAVAGLMQHGVSPPALVCIGHLLEHGAVFDPTAIEIAVSHDGTEVLALVKTLGADISALGGQALMRAAALDNDVAVSWLLTAGVDVLGYSILGRYEISLGVCSFPSPRMLRHLVEQGAPLRNRRHDSGLVELLDMYWGQMPHARTNVDWLRISREILYDFLEYGMQLSQPAASCLLEQSAQREDWELFAVLLDGGAPLGPGSPLACLIWNYAPATLVRRVLDLDPDLDAPSNCRHSAKNTPASAAAWRWNLGLLKELAARGARLDLPNPGMTLFQACRSNPLNAQEAEAQVATVRYLLQHAKCAQLENEVLLTDASFTDALRAAVSQGSLELVIILLEAGIDCNSSNSREPYWNKCVLHIAVRRGFLDITQLLLNNGAVSEHQRRTPLDGAIDLALENNSGHHNEIARLIARFAISLGYTLEDRYRYFCL